MLVRNLLSMVLVTNSACIAGADESPGAARLDYFGYENCVALQNESCRVVLCHQAGGRVLEFSLNGTNAIYLDPDAAGWSEGSDGRPNMTGGRFDIGPEQVVPARPTLWQGPWTAEITGPRAAKLSSQVDESTGVRLTREFRLDADAARLHCTQTIHNVSDELKEYCHWSRTFAVGGGIVLVPLTPPSRFPNFYTMRRGFDEILIRPLDDNIRVRDRFLEILAAPEHPKLGIESYAGWFAYLMPNDVAFIKRFPTFRDRAHSEVDAHNVSIWYPASRPMIELEPLGPRETLQPGRQASFTEMWELEAFPFPASGEEVNLERLRSLARPAEE
jgi:hypothetical protein